MKFFTKAAKVIPADKYIDNTKLPVTTKHIRKLERLGSKQRQEYLDKRAALRSELLEYENALRRVRSMFSHCYLFRLLIFAEINYDNAHFHMREAFRLIINNDEHMVLLHYFHSYMSIFTLSGKEEICLGINL